MTQRNLGDVVVVGLVHNVHVIEDISINVPYGMTVVIPADKALRSKHLWQGINQRCLHKVPAGAPVPTQFVKKAPSSLDPDKVRMEAQIRALTDTLQKVQKDNHKLRKEQSDKLDAIMAAIQNGVVQQAPTLPHQSHGRQNTKTHQTQEDFPMVADGSAPTFLPSQIKPEGAEARIEVQGEESESKVSSAAEKLRKLRKKKG